MAEAKKTEQPELRYITGRVPDNLWREFRKRLLDFNFDVNKGLETAIKEWLASSTLSTRR